MAKSIDKLVAHGVVVPENMFKDEADKELMNKIYQATPVVVDNVFHSFWKRGENIHSLGTLIPPFNVTWIEGSLSALPGSYDPHDRSRRDKYRAGILYEAQEIVDGKLYGLDVDLDKDYAKLPFGWDRETHTKEHMILTSASYWCSCFFFLDLGKGHKKLLGPTVYTGFPLDDEGKFMPDESTRIVERFTQTGWKANLPEGMIGGDGGDLIRRSVGPNGGVYTETKEKAKILHMDLIKSGPPTLPQCQCSRCVQARRERGAMSFDPSEKKDFGMDTVDGTCKNGFHIGEGTVGREGGRIIRGRTVNEMGAAFFAVEALLFSISVINCRNIGTVLVKRSKGHQKKFKKQTGKPLLSYRVIKVHLDRKNRAITLKSNKHSDEEVDVAPELPLHAVRGHFKEYTKERPLFGRLVGRWWWPPSQRGDKEHGEIIKEYDIVE